MALSENEEISKRINDLGCLANAWTNYQGTNYNLFGSGNIIESLNLLLDIFYNTDINEKNVEEEKGIIGEEIDMYKDNINSLMFTHLYNNLFHNSYVNNTVVGKRSDIQKITAKSLNKIYNDYYAPNNTFIIVTGDFNANNVLDFIKDYIGKLNLSKKELPKRIKSKEKDSVKIPYEEIKKDVENTRVMCASKINKKVFGIKDDMLLKYYINIILSINFSPTSHIYEKYRNENIILNMNGSVDIIDDHVILLASAVCNDGEKFINNIFKDAKKMKLTKSEFERKKKLFLKSYILDFDNIEDVEYNITTDILMKNKVNYKEYSYIQNMNYEEAKRILELINFDNYSIIRTIK